MRSGFSLFLVLVLMPLGVLGEKHQEKATSSRPTTLKLPSPASALDFSAPSDLDAAALYYAMHSKGFFAEDPSVFPSLVLGHALLDAGASPEEAFLAALGFQAKYRADFLGADIPSLEFVKSALGSLSIGVDLKKPSSVFGVTLNPAQFLGGFLDWGHKNRLIALSEKATKEHLKIDSTSLIKFLSTHDFHPKAFFKDLTSKKTVRTNASLTRVDMTNRLLTFLGNKKQFDLDSVKKDMRFHSYLLGLKIYKNQETILENQETLLSHYGKGGTISRIEQELTKAISSFQNHTKWERDKASFEEVKNGIHDEARHYIKIIAGLSLFNKSPETEAAAATAISAVRVMEQLWIVEAAHNYIPQLYDKAAADSILGSYGRGASINIIGIVTNLVGTLMSILSGKPSIEQLILKDVRALRKQVAQMTKELRASSRQTRMLLYQMNENIGEQLGRIEWLIREVKQDQRRYHVQQSRMEEKIAQLVRDNSLANIHRDYQSKLSELEKTCASLEDCPTITQADLWKNLGELKRLIVNESRRSSTTGPHQIPKDSLQEMALLRQPVPDLRVGPLHGVLLRAGLTNDFTSKPKTTAPWNVDPLAKPHPRSPALSPVAHQFLSHGVHSFGRSVSRWHPFLLKDINAPNTLVSGDKKSHLLRWIDEVQHTLEEARDYSANIAPLDEKGRMTTWRLLPIAERYVQARQLLSNAIEKEHQRLETVRFSSHGVAVDYTQSLDELTQSQKFNLSESDLIKEGVVSKCAEFKRDPWSSIENPPHLKAPGIHVHLNKSLPLEYRFLRKMDRGNFHVCYEELLPVDPRTTRTEWEPTFSKEPRLINHIEAKLGVVLRIEFQPKGQKKLVLARTLLVDTEYKPWMKEYWQRNHFTDEQWTTFNREKVSPKHIQKIQAQSAIPMMKKRPKFARPRPLRWWISERRFEGLSDDIGLSAYAAKRFPKMIPQLVKLNKMTSNAQVEADMKFRSDTRKQYAKETLAHIWKWGEDLDREASDVGIALRHLDRTKVEFEAALLEALGKGVVAQPAIAIQLSKIPNGADFLRQIYKHYINTKQENPQAKLANLNQIQKHIREGREMEQLLTLVSQAPIQSSVAKNQLNTQIQQIARLRKLIENKDSSKTALLELIQSDPNSPRSRLQEFNRSTYWTHFGPEVSKTLNDFQRHQLTGPSALTAPQLNSLKVGIDALVFEGHRPSFSELNQVADLFRKFHSDHAYYSGGGTREKHDFAAFLTGNELPSKSKKKKLPVRPLKPQLQLYSYLLSRMSWKEAKKTAREVFAIVPPSDKREFAYLRKTADRLANSRAIPLSKLNTNQLTSILQLVPHALWRNVDPRDTHAFSTAMHETMEHLSMVSNISNLTAATFEPVVAHLKATGQLQGYPFATMDVPRKKRIHSELSLAWMAFSKNRNRASKTVDDFQEYLAKSTFGKGPIHGLPKSTLSSFMYQYSGQIESTNKIPKLPKPTKLSQIANELKKQFGAKNKLPNRALTIRLE